MANTNNPKFKPVKKKSSNEQRNFIISMVVIAAMILSGVYYLTMGSDSGNQGEQTTPTIKYNSYTVTPYTSPNAILVKVNETQRQYVALSGSQCLSNQVIGWVYNMSVPGISTVIMDAANPVVQESAICGTTYLLFRFALNNPTNETLPRLTNELDNRLGGYFLKQVYSGTILNGSNPTSGRIDVIGNLDTMPGDLVEIIVFRMEDGNMIALEKQKVYIGPTIPGKVVSVDDLLASGTINESFNSSGIEGELNLLDSRITLPVMSINMNLSENLTREIANITGAAISSKDNITEIDYNNSYQQVSSILIDEGINYTIINGSVSFQMPANTSIEYAEKTLSDRGLVGINLKKKGSVALPQTVMFGNITADIPNNGNYTTILELGTAVGDKINVSLTVLQFGDQVYIAGARQEI